VQKKTFPESSYSTKETPVTETASLSVRLHKSIDTTAGLMPPTVTLTILARANHRSSLTFVMDGRK
jgi:hypothetical protein